MTNIKNKIKKFLYGDPGQFMLEETLTISGLIIGIFLSIVGIVGNWAYNFPLPAILIPVALCIILLILFYEIRIKRTFSKIILPVLIFIFILIACIWIFNGGYNGGNNYVLYVAFTLALSITSPKKNRIIFGAFFVILIPLQFLQYYYPGLIVQYENETLRFSDSIITLIYSMISVYFIINTLHKNYIEERQRAMDRGIELELLNQKLTESNHTKDKFFSIIAHDLKSPLGTHRELIRLMVDSYDSFTNEERLNILTLMKDSSDNVFNLLENLLEWARIQKDQIVYKPVLFRLIDLLENLKNSLDILAQKKNITIDIKVEKELFVNADMDMLKSIFRNLITNSIKFTEEGGSVSITAVQNNRTIEISVKDNGIGIPDSIINLLFNLGENTSRKGTQGEASTGLGLHLCKEFVDKHQGSIKVESEVGKGSTFTVSLNIL